MRNTILIAATLLSTAAFAETLTGTIDEPSLRRKTDLVYVEKVDNPAKPVDVVMNQKGNTYEPHVLAVQVGAKVKFQSEDPELHNVFARNGHKVAFNQAVLPKTSWEKQLTEPGVIHLTCNIHKEMSAYLLVLQNGFFAKPDQKTGKFTIEGLKPGTYTVRIWGEGLTDEQNAKKFTVEVKAGAEPMHVASK